MTDNLTLTSRNDAHTPLATFFELVGDHTVQIDVREDQCFSKGWLNLGTIILRPSQDPYHGDRPKDLLLHAVKNGSFEWRTPTQAILEDEVLTLIEENTASQKEKLKHALIGLSHAVQRIGLRSPLFDAIFLSQLPLQRSATIVADTNAVLQGALDFAARYLSPIARLKVPAVAQMEVSGWAANYFKMRREGKLAKSAGTGLQAHMRSQGAQRALMRLELSLQTETERVRFGADPLRGIMQNDSDKEHQNLGLQVIQQGFADRLIFETALQHLHASSPGHRVVLMTSDQGLARMCLSEGVDVAFYRAGQIEDITDTVLTGTNFNPFSQALHHTALADVLWELAVAFGSCRLRSAHADLEVFAIGEALNWTPYHAAEDLLWVRIVKREASAGGASTPAPPEDPAPDEVVTDAAFPVELTVDPNAEEGEPKRPGAPPSGAAIGIDDNVQVEGLENAAPPPGPNIINQDTAKPKEPGNIDQEDDGSVLEEELPEELQNERTYANEGDGTDAVGKRAFIAAYKFSPLTMLRLIQNLSSSGSLSNAEVMSKFHFTHERKVQEYRGFLLSSDLVTYDQGVLTANERLLALWNAMRVNDFSSFAPFLCSSVAMKSVQEFLQIGQGVPANQLPIREAAAPGYICLQEMSGILLEIHEDGVYATPNRPLPREFSEIAYEAYVTHARTEGTYIASGTWLETLAKNHGVHPLWSRRMLEEARVQRLLERYVEGSTPDTRFSRHTFCMSEFDHGNIAVKQVALFEGDFLLPGKSSASLRLKRPS